MRVSCGKELGLVGQTRKITVTILATHLLGSHFRPGAERRNN